MKYSAQREHALRSLLKLSFYLYVISYLLFPSLSLYAIRHGVYYCWLAVRKEVVRHQLRWSVVPLIVFALSLWVHTATTPTTPIMMDFIGRVTPAPLSVVILLDVMSTVIELLISALFYHNVIIIAQALQKTKMELGTKTPDTTQIGLSEETEGIERSGRLEELGDIVDTADSTMPFLPSFAKPTQGRKRTPLILDLSLSTFASLLFTPKALANAHGVQTPSERFSQIIRASRANMTNSDGRDGRADEYELEERLLRRNENVEAGLPLPFNLVSTPTRPARNTRTDGPRNPIPGALGTDW